MRDFQSVYDGIADISFPLANKDKETGQLLTAWCFKELASHFLSIAQKT